MAQTPFSLLLLRRLSSKNITHHHQRKLSLLLSHGRRSIRPFSSSQPNPPSSSSSSSSNPKPSSLSARMSFVFDQIDAIEQQQSDKDQTLQRIRAWRQSKKSPNPKLAPESVANDNEASVSPEQQPSSTEPKLVESNPEDQPQVEVELVHPWPEWIELIERLVQQKYFDFSKNEDETEQQCGAPDHDHDSVAVVDGDAELDFTKDFKTVQAACFKFGKDRFDILRSLSRKDIQILVGYGCPSSDKKVAFSGKLLRKHAHLDEGDVCSSCSLRNSCVRAYLVPKKEDEARTIDVMRVLLTFAFDPDPDNGSVENKPLTKQKSVGTVVRKLLYQIVKLSAVPIDPNLPPPVIRKPPPKVKQPPTPPKKRIGRDDVEMKKGDWICSKCDFLNFAKNTVCLQCDAQRPKRQLLPGEWECPECNFLNYRRNVVCFHCECKRPPDAYTEGNMQQKQFGARTNFEKLASRPEVSNAWNFDFDDDESDGADVAAFEYADSAVHDNSPSDSPGRGNSVHKVSRVIKDQERNYSDPDGSRPGMGFDDFDDFDDVNSFELETPHNPTCRVSANDLSEDDEYSEFENSKGSHNNMSAYTRTSSKLYNNPSTPLSQKSAISSSEDDYMDFRSNRKPSVNSKRQSNNFGDSRLSRSQVDQSRGLSISSDEDFGLDSDVDEDLSGNFRPRQIRTNSPDDEDSSFSGSESDGMDHIERLGGRRGNFRDLDSIDDDDRALLRNRARGGKLESNRRGISNSRSNRNFTRDSGMRSNGFSEDLDSSPLVSHNYRDSESDDKLPSSRNSSRGVSGRRGSFKDGNNVTRHSGTRSGRVSENSHRSPRKSCNYNDSESDDEDDDDLPSHRNRSNWGNVQSSRRGNFNGRSNYNSTSNSRYGSNDSGEDFGRSPRGSRGNNNSRGFPKDDNGRKMNARGANSSKSRGSGRGRGGFGKKQSGRYGDNRMDEDFGEIRNSRRIIER